MSTKRPSLAKAKYAFKNVYDDIGKTVSAVGKLIGGKVDYNINHLTPAQGQFKNACAIRMSYVLNQTGIKVPHMPGKTVSGGDGSWYMYKVKDLLDFLRRNFGEPDITISSPTIEKLLIRNPKGIIVFEVDQWDDATGHTTVWDGLNCSDSCYFAESTKVYLWELKN
ncbi:MAG: type VI secretion system amidase effector protein Tae4 [Gammaproteobacteria bacterium]|nr:type VI secretion system amidase effector protein Tae4 [Gammaproteobacteria bacterium]